MKKPHLADGVEKVAFGDLLGRSCAGGFCLLGCCLCLLELIKRRGLGAAALAGKLHLAQSAGLALFARLA